jgi:hypothetical protein
MDDHEALDCTLIFERSSSPYYREAVRLARTVPGYRRSCDDEPERHRVPFSVAALPVMERLLRLVSGWRGSVVQVQGIALYGAETFRLLHMLGCYRRRERSRLGMLYCWGLPERGRGRLPCRLVEAALPWTPPDDYAEPRLLPSLLEAQASETFAALCPAYDAESIEQAARTWLGDPASSRSALERLLGDLDVDLGDGA